MTASLCWAQPKGGAWVLAERTVSGDVILPDGRTLDTLETAAHNVSHTLNWDDPTYMDDLHEAPLLDLLRRRFQQGTIYTWAGPDVLLSVNPFRTIPRLYDLPDGWRRAATAAAERKSSSTPPHVFSVAERAWRSVSAPPARRKPWSATASRALARPKPAARCFASSHTRLPTAVR